MAERARARVAFGVAGWSYPDWNGRVYRSGGPRGLELLAAVLDAAEVNSTFYRIPAPAQARGWLDKVSDNPAFSFCVKGWSGFTHDRNYGPSDLSAFLAAIEPLRASGRLGAVLLQFPWSFRHDRESSGWLDRLATDLAGVPLAIELRHRSWERREVLESLSARGLAWCNIDQPLFPDSIGPGERVTASLGYVRLHGRNAAAWFREDAGRDERYDYLYSRDELLPWAERIRRLGGRAREVYVIANNHFQGQAVVNVLELKAMVTGEPPRVPAAWIESFPRLLESCRPDGRAQLTLFP